jgi:hypothetical protein
MPHLEDLLGGLLVLNGAVRKGASLHSPRPDVVLRAVDACLGVPGLPQSATGQTALFTGINAPALVGDHITGQPTARLRQVIAEHSLLKCAAQAGARVTFANAHSEEFWELVRTGKRRLGASTLTALAADAPIPTMADLLAGRAVLWDITHELAVEQLGRHLPLVSPEEAGARLARLAGKYDLVLYETFLPDLAGHRRIDPVWVLPRLDAFLGALLAQRPPEVTLIVSSDHGNLENMATRAHTVNPVPLLAVGPGAVRFGESTAITDVAPAILALLEKGPAAERTEDAQAIATAEPQAQPVWTP